MMIYRIQTHLFLVFLNHFFFYSPPLITVVDHFDLPRERVSVFTNFLDRYLQKYLAEHPEGMAKRHFQLLSLTCLYITIKIECSHHAEGGGVLSMDMMIHLSREKFTRQQMTDMEQEILRTLEWKLSPPTPSIFFQHFLLLLQPPSTTCAGGSGQVKSSVHHDTMETARFLMELAALDYQSVKQRPSRIALAALLNAMDERRKTTDRNTTTAATAAVEEGQYRFLLSMIDPSERMTVEQCRARLSSLFHGLAANEDEGAEDEGIHQEASSYGRMTSPVSVAQPIHPHGLY